MAVEIPRWARPHFNHTSYQKVEDAIAAAEDSTSGEIIPMLVRRSSTVGHVPIMIFLLVWLACEVIDAAALIYPAMNHWAWELIYFVFALVIAAVLGRLQLLQRWLIAAEDREYQVDMRAEVEFYEAGLTATSGRTGVLIFVSLMEHRVTVLADLAISSKLPPETWNGVVARVVEGIKHNDLAGGLCAAIGQCGELLQKHFPRPDDDINQLHDHLIIKE